MTKEQFVSVLRAAGITEDQMKRLHAEFESRLPEEHQQFLEFLQINAEEIKSIRTWSATARN
jgi:hypothetical protein